MIGQHKTVGHPCHFPTRIGSISTRLALIVGLGVWRAACGHGFDPVPKLAFNLARGDAAASAGGADAVVVFLGHLVHVPVRWFEAFHAIGVLALVGLVVDRRRALLPHWLLLGLAVVLVCAFLPRRRFLVSWIYVLGPFAIAGMRRLPQRAQLPVFLVAVLISLLLSLRLPELP